MKKKLFRSILESIEADPARWERSDDRWTHFDLDLMLILDRSMLGSTFTVCKKGATDRRVGFNERQAKAILALLYAEAKRQHKAKERAVSVDLVAAFVAGDKKSALQK